MNFSVSNETSGNLTEEMPPNYQDILNNTLKIETVHQVGAIEVEIRYEVRWIMLQYSWSDILLYITTWF